MRRFPSVLTIVALLLLNGCPARKGEVADRSRMTGRAEPQSGQLGLLKLPAGFRIELFASALRTPRMMALSPDGRLFVTEMRAGKVTILPDTNSDGRADGHITYADGLNAPHGIAFHGGYLYIAETGRVIRYRYRESDMKAPRPNVVVPDLPTGGGHFTRTISFGPDGKLYVSVGSSCNVCIEKSPLRAAITRYDADGSNGRIVATGLRNSVGLAWNPKTDELWATDNGRDYLGDDLPPEEINVIREGGFYGWPYAYGDRVPDPEFGDRAPAKVSSSVPPKIKMQAHSAPLGLAFYTGDMFPAEYRGDLFICYHGSWNRSVPTGYKVVRFDIEDGRVVGGQHDFITGWLQGDEAWGRPVGLLVGRHGELFITDDSGGRVYRVTYRAASA